MSGMHPDELDLERAMVAGNAARIAELGGWPSFIDPQTSLTDRVPQPGQTDAPGFDAGLACALDLIPRNRQYLAACLHAAYTPRAVAQVLREAQEMPADSETCWWLAACSVCREGEVDVPGFQAQLREFAALAADPRARRDAAIRELALMRSRFELQDDVPFATQDGGMQGAYLSGHKFAAMYASHQDLYFIGTYEESLGLETFPWSEDLDDQGRPRSGGVHNSKQFVKCSSLDEYRRAVAQVKNRFAR